MKAISCPTGAKIARPTVRAAHAGAVGERGMTLVELLVGLAITAMLMVSLASMLQTAQAASQATLAQVELQAQAQFAIQRVAYQIGMTPNALLSAKADDRTSQPWALNAGYTWDPVASTLTEAIGPGTSIVAENVTGFAITSPVIEAGQTLVTTTIVLTQGNATASAAMTTRMGGLL